MKILRTIAFFACIAGMSLLLRAEDINVPVSDRNAYILLDHLLGLSDIGPKSAAQLERYKQWISVHIALRRQGLLTKSQMKVYLFVTFVASETAKVESLEEIAREIVPMFKRQPSVLLDAITEAPFLTRSTCEQIGTHFDLFGTPQDRRQFLSEYEKMFVGALGLKGASDCLNKLRVS